MLAKIDCQLRRPNKATINLNIFSSRNGYKLAPAVQVLDIWHWVSEILGTGFRKTLLNQLVTQ